MTIPGPTEGAGAGGTHKPSQPDAPKNPFAGAVDTQDPWYKYAQQMFPNQAITPEIIAGLKRNMMSMINTTISQINARQAEAQRYNERVAKGED
jgi:hypothetical protein